MTEREWVIAELAAAGKTNMEIADAIDRSHATVLKRMSSIYKDLGVEGDFHSFKRKRLPDALAIAKVRAGRIPGAGWRESAS